jgi:hypothetical protein
MGTRCSLCPVPRTQYLNLAPVAQLDRASAFKHAPESAFRSLYRETEPVKWIALYRGNLNSW